MPLRSYGVLTARVVDRRREDHDDSPHFQIELADERGTRLPAAVNVKSQESPSELLYLVDEDFRHPITDRCRRPPSGLDAAAARARRARPRLHPGQPLRPGGDAVAARRTPPGPDNDLADLLDHYVQRAVADPQAVLYVFGERWGPEAHQRQDLRLRAGQRRPRHPHEPGQQRRLPPRRRGVAGRRAAPPLPGHVAVGRDLPRLPEPGVAHRRRDRPCPRGHRPAPSAGRRDGVRIWRPWSTRSARLRSGRPSRSSTPLRRRST